MSDIEAHTKLFADRVAFEQALASLAAKDAEIAALRATTLQLKADLEASRRCARLAQDAHDIMRARVAQLEVVHRELAQICWEGGSLDGGKLQDLLVKHGVLVEATVEKPCSEYCNCEYYDAVFPTTCYRLKDAPQ